MGFVFRSVLTKLDKETVVILKYENCTQGLSQSAPLDTRPSSTRRWNSYFREAWDSGSSEMERKFDHMKYTYTCSQEPLYADDLMSMIFKYHFCDLLFKCY